MSKFWQIMKFEFFTITGKKSWLIPTAIFILVAFLVAFIPQIAGFFGYDDFLKSPEVAVEQPGEDFEMPLIGVVLESPDVTLAEIQYFRPTASEYPNESALEQALLADDIQEAYVIHSADSYTPLLKDTSVFMGPVSPFDQVMYQMREKKLIGDALDYPAYQAAMSKPVESMPKILGTDGKTNYGFTYGLIFVVYFLVIFYGTTVSVSVAREKSDRTMELLITSAHPSKLFYGKVVGAGLAGLLQFSLIVAAIFLGFGLNHKAWDFDIIRFFDIPPKVFIIFLAFTLVGYLLYLFIYAMLGSTVSKVEDVNTASMPIMLLMVGSFMIVNFSMNNPDSLVMRVTSFIPFSSPFAMFARSALGSGVKDWEVLLSFGLLVAMTIVTAFVAAKLYRLGTLNYGNRLKLGEAIKLIRQDAE